MEFLMTAVEPIVNHVSEGKPVYVKNMQNFETDRIERYQNVSKGELEFASLVVKVFGKNSFKIQKETVVKWVNYLIVTLNDSDRAYFDEVYWAGDVMHQEYIPLFEHMWNYYYFIIELPEKETLK